MLSQKQPLDNPIPGSKLIPILVTFTILTFFICEKVKIDGLKFIPISLLFNCIFILSTTVQDSEIPFIDIKVPLSILLTNHVAEVSTFVFLLTLQPINEFFSAIGVSTL